MFIHRVFKRYWDSDILKKRVEEEILAIKSKRKIAEQKIEQNQQGFFGPNHYARFFCRQFKIYRGSRGTWGNRGIVNDYKWRYPKA